MTSIPGNFIGGRCVPAASGQTLDVWSPATGKICGAVARSDERDVEAAARAAQAAQAEWAGPRPSLARRGC